MEQRCNRIDDHLEHYWVDDFWGRVICFGERVYDDVDFVSKTSQLYPEDRLYVSMLRLRALAAQGWSLNELSHSLGYTPAALSRVRNGKGVSISRGFHDSIEIIYHRLREIAPKGRAPGRQRALAAKAGWDTAERQLERFLDIIPDPPNVLQ